MPSLPRSWVQGSARLTMTEQERWKISDPLERLHAWRAREGTRGCFCRLVLRLSLGLDPRFAQIRRRGGNSSLRCGRSIKKMEGLSRDHCQADMLLSWPCVFSWLAQVLGTRSLTAGAARAVLRETISFTRLTRRNTVEPLRLGSPLLWQTIPLQYRHQRNATRESLARYIQTRQTRFNTHSGV